MHFLFFLNHAFVVDELKMPEPRSPAHCSDSSACLVPHTVSQKPRSLAIPNRPNPSEISPLPKGCHLAFTFPDWGKPAQETNMAHFTQLGLSGNSETQR